MAYIVSENGFKGFYVPISHHNKAKLCFCFIFTIGCNVQVTSPRYDGKARNE